MHSMLEDLVKRFPTLAAGAGEIERAFELLRGCYARSGKVLLAGNGGSAADAEHWSGELLKGFACKRPLPAAAKAKLPADLAAGLQQALPAIPLTSFIALTTAFANDVSADFTFAQLVWGLGSAGDVLVAISTSGNAANVLHAADAAKAKGLSVLGLTGQTGGKLAAKCDVCIRVNESKTFLVQELHLPIYHSLCLMLEQSFFPGG
jgi:D-sedoheptulose 7-phosphate isomerase